MLSGRFESDSSVILDATYSRRLHRDQLRDKLRSAGIAFCFVEAKASNNTIRQRLKGRTGKKRPSL